MTSKTLGNLTDADALTGTEDVYVVQSSNSRKSTTQDIADLGTSQDNMTDGTTNKNYTATEKTKLAGISGTNTGDQTTITGNAGTATKLATARNIDGQAFDGSANVTVIAPGTHAATGKTTPVDADELALVDSAASNVLKKLTWTNLKATLKTYFDTLYLAKTIARREVLTADRTYYVATTGADTNDGLASGTAFLTIQKAMDVIAANLDLGPYDVTVQIATGTYGNLLLKSYRATSGHVYFQGDTTTPSNVLLNAASGNSISTDAGATGYWRVHGFKVAGTSSNRGIYVVGPGTKVDIGEIDFGTTDLRHMEVAFGGQITASGNLFVSGNTGVGFWGGRQGSIFLSGHTITYLASVTYANHNWHASEQGWIDGYSMTFVLGSFTVTGQRYAVANLGGIFTNGGGASYIPGSIAGSGNGVNGAIYV